MKTPGPERPSKGKAIAHSASDDNALAIAAADRPVLLGWGVAMGYPLESFEP